MKVEFRSSNVFAMKINTKFGGRKYFVVEKVAKLYHLLYAVCILVYLCILEHVFNDVASYICYEHMVELLLRYATTLPTVGLCYYSTCNVECFMKPTKHVVSAWK